VKVTAFLADFAACFGAAGFFGSVGFFFLPLR
jgi:hypothetical protein